MTEERELWNPDVQARDRTLVAKEAEAAIAREWERVWELPIPFFREKYEAAGLSRDEVPPLDEIPRTVKDEFREDDRRHPPFGSYRAFGLDDAVRLGASTGTTGRPTLIFYGPRDVEAHIEASRRSVWRHGMRPGDRFTHSWPQGLYPTGVAGGRNYLDLEVLEIPVGPPFSEEMAAGHLTLWEMLEPNGFMMTGSQLQTYEAAAEANGVDLLGLLDGAKVAFLEASCQFEEPRRRVEETYGFELRNIGGASEVPGFSVSDCRYHTGLHAMGDHYVVQACDPETGREVAEGERGTLVVTAFGIDTFMVRYDLQDIVTVSTEPCACGETGPRYTLLGRQGDLVTVDGTTLLPIDVQLALEGEGSPEFQVVRDGDQADELRLRVETERPADVGERLRHELGVPVDVEGVEAGTLPRSSFKPRRVS